MIFGTGIDIIDIERVRKVYDNHPAFKHKIFTDREIAYCESKADPGMSYAVRFAAKEAFMKALGTGWNHEVSWVEIEIVSSDNGKPLLEISGHTNEKLTSLKISACHLSLSHEKGFAVANVILETSENLTTT
jgi:holo-[acyl-carrier protein] synthase